MISLPKSEIKPISCKGICFFLFFSFLSTYFLSFTLLCLIDEQYKLEKKVLHSLFTYFFSFKIQILYSLRQGYCRLQLHRNRYCVLILVYHDLPFFSCTSILHCIFTSFLSQEQIWTLNELEGGTLRCDGLSWKAVTV